MNKHIVHVIPTLKIGGAETMLMQLVHGLTAPFFNHTIITLQEAGVLAPVFEKMGARVVSLGMPAGVPNMPGLTDVLQKAINAPPDVLQGWRYHGNIIAQTMRSVMTQPKPPVVWSIHSAGPATEAVELAHPQMQKMNVMLSGVADAIVYTSVANMANHLERGFSKTRAVVVPSGIDTQAFKPNREMAYRLRTRLGLAPETKIVGLVEPLRMPKDPQTFFDALEASGGTDMHFVLVGHDYDMIPNPFNEALPSQIKDRVHPLGIQRDMPALLAGLDVMTRSSRLEAMPRTMLEAMSCGVLCVCMDSGEVPHLLKDVGWTAPAGDGKALLEAWNTALTCAPGEAQQRRDVGRQRVEAQYTPSAMVNAFSELWAKLAAVPT